MRELIEQAVAPSRNIIEVSDAVLDVLSEVRQQNPDQLIAYVAGAITADGPERIVKNGRLLAARTDDVRRVHPFSFCAPYIFTAVVYDRIQGLSLTQQVYKDFFRRKLRSGYVDVVYMTPGWQRSEGSRDEYETAKALGIHVVDMQCHNIWRWIDGG